MNGSKFVRVCLILSVPPAAAGIISARVPKSRVFEPFLDIFMMKFKNYPNAFSSSARSLDFSVGYNLLATSVQRGLR